MANSLAAVEEVARASADSSVSETRIGDTVATRPIIGDKTGGVRVVAKRMLIRSSKVRVCGHEFVYGHRFRTQDARPAIFSCAFSPFLRILTARETGCVFKEV